MRYELTNGWYYVVLKFTPLDIFPPGRTCSRDISPTRTIPPPFLHGVAHFSPYHHHAPINIKRSTVNMYKTDSS